MQPANIMCNKIVTALLFIFPNFMFGQTCLHKDLSYELDFRTQIKRIKTAEEVFDSCLVKIMITDKSGHVIQTIQLKSMDLFEGAFKNCNAIRSFTTGKNVKEEALDNDYGDVIVADLNFDSKEDIAIKNASGGNGGP